MQARGRTYHGPVPAPHRHRQRPLERVRGPFLASPGWRRSVRGLATPRGPRSLHGWRTPEGLQAVVRGSSRSELVRLWRRGRRGWPASGRGHWLRAWLFLYEFGGAHAEYIGYLL